MKHKLTAQELGNFCRQLGILIHSGMGPLESLHILLEESEADTDHEILSVLLSSMEKTGSLSQAVTDSGFFPNSMAAYIKTGEQTGCLDEILDSLSGNIRADSKRSHLSASHARHDGNRYYCPSCQSTSDLPAGIPADGNGNERIFQPASECRQYYHPLFCLFSDSGSYPDRMHPVSLS